MNLLRPALGKLLFAALLLLLLSGCQHRRGPFGIGAIDRLNLADRYTKEENYDAAIAEYRKHIAERLADPDRPQWENPHFYELIIGDIELARGTPDAALAAYEQAEKAEVTDGLVLDRYRLVAHWYEERGDFAKATEVLLRYRERDPLLFDLMLDRIARKITNREDSPHILSIPSPSPSPSS